MGALVRLSPLDSPHRWDCHYWTVHKGEIVTIGQSTQVRLLPLDSPNRWDCHHWTVHTGEIVTIGQSTQVRLSLFEQSTQLRLPPLDSPHSWDCHYWRPLGFLLPITTPITTHITTPITTHMTSPVQHMDGRPRSIFGRLVDLDNYVEAISRLLRKRLSALGVLGRFLSTGLVTNTIFRYDFLKNMKNLPSSQITWFLHILKT